MNSVNAKEHWEQVYEKKALPEVSWYQVEPKASWDLMGRLGVSPLSPVLDVGGGDSLFVDFLLQKGFRDITVLDISEKAIERGKKRVGGTDRVQWVVADVTQFRPSRKYALWHDRAVLHFLTETSSVDSYLETARLALAPGGQVVVGTFSEKGPLKCSGLVVQQYSEATLVERFSKWFRKIVCIEDAHVTPSQAVQNFTFCGFERMS